MLAEEVAERVEQIKARRAKAMSAKDGAELGANARASPCARVRVKRAGRDLHLLARASVVERQLDQQLLDSVPFGLARDVVEERVQQIRVRRGDAIATGVHGDPGVERRPKRRRLRLRPQISKATIQKS